MLSLIDYNLRILMWIDMWGVGAGWGIRVELIVVGAILFVLFKGKGDDEEEEQSPEGGEDEQSSE